jgi:hypothetical protein
MASTPDIRLARLTRHVQQGWQAIQEDPALRRQAREWLVTHPSPRADVDQLWLACLDDTGPLADWLQSQKLLQAWKEPLPLHTVLASHPFPFLRSWLTRPTSRAS